MVRLHPRTCGSEAGLEGHRAAGTDPCTWCLRAAEPPPETPSGVRYFRVGGAIVSTQQPTPGLLAMLAAGEAIELTGGPQ